MHWIKSYLFSILLSFSVVTVNGQQSSISSFDEKYFSIFLIGDAGKFSDATKHNLESLKKQMDAAGSASSTVFLGDNIYPAGMPSEEDKYRQEAEENLKSKLDIIRDYEGKAMMVPGNHDWRKGKKDGWESVLRAQKFANDYLQKQQVIVPEDGCPGPISYELTEDILLVLFDSQWILHPSDRPGENESCEAKTGLEFFAQLQDIIKMNEHKKIVLASHHTILSYGIHGGRSNFRQHVFPLTDIHKNLYLPLPIVGSIYPLYRKYLGNIQDHSHPMYKVMRKSLQELMEMYPNIIYASGHDHSLQHISKNDAHYVVSGSGSLTSFVKDGKYSEFTASIVGYARLDFHGSGLVKLKFISTEISNDEVIFEKELFNKPYIPNLDPYTNTSLNFNNQTTMAHVSDQYGAGKGKVRWFGANYRDIWSQDVEVPVFDIGQEHGGLNIVQRGGGFQTKSLRLEAKNGKQYVLRSIEKYTSKAIPEVLRGSFAADVVQDQISASHPYGAFVVPGLAVSAGIYHTNPKAVFIPQDPRFGKYQEEFGGTVALYEERPSGNWKDADHFGNSKKIVNTQKVIKSLKNDNDNFVDQEFVLKNRLFDLIIADWDRHDDQWRWASFKEDKGIMYRPIPRDRDQAFFVNQGILPKIASRKWAMPKFQGFDYELKNVSGFMFNARWFDRSFINGLSKEDWINTAKELQQNLTDESIESAIKQWPDSIYAKNGPIVISKLKSRRDRLSDYAIDHYNFLSRKVDVVGSDKRELFDLERNPDGSTKVVVYKLNKDGEKKKTLYSRSFDKDETKEIRLYGLGGKDKFNIHGNGKSAIKTRVIGGKGRDTIIDQSIIRGWGRHTLIYDTKGGTYIEKGKEGRNLSSNASNINEYNRKSFKYNLTVPLITANYNVDDGIFIGGGLLRTTHGFRKDPFKNKHLLLGMVAFKTGSFDLRYKGTFNHVIGSLDAQFNFDLEGPNYTFNYFGMGNESEFDQNQDIDYYRVQIDNVLGSFYLRQRFRERFHVSIGPRFENINMRGNDQRFVELEFNNGDTILNAQTYSGLGAEIELDTRDRSMMPHKGVHLKIHGKSMKGLNNYSNDYGNISGFFAFYWSFRDPTAITISNRTGGGMSFGDFEFYQANTLGGSGKMANLRGYRRTRFYGNNSFYNNTEIRFTLFGFKTYLFPSHFGILVFNDIGRVWLEGEESNKWHQSMGGGIWLSPFESVVLSSTIAFGEEETLITVNFGFLF